jgi:hypothetical protein
MGGPLSSWSTLRRLQVGFRKDMSDTNSSLDRHSLGAIAAE